MAEPKLEDLLDEIELFLKLVQDPDEKFFESAYEEPHKFTLSNIGEREELRQIGSRDIPRIGKVIAYLAGPKTRHFLEGEDQKLMFLESTLGEVPAAIVEQVENVYHDTGSHQVKLKIARYSIHKTVK